MDSDFDSVSQPKATGEAKTKPTQSSVRELRGLGLSPDLIVCRSEHPIGQEVKDKISNFCHVPPDQVIRTQSFHLSRSFLRIDIEQLNIRTIKSDCRSVE